MTTLSHSATHYRYFRPSFFLSQSIEQFGINEATYILGPIIRGTKFSLVFCELSFPLSVFIFVSIFILNFKKDSFSPLCLGNDPFDYLHRINSKYVWPSLRKIWNKKCSSDISFSAHKTNIFKKHLQFFFEYAAIRPLYMYNSINFSVVDHKLQYKSHVNCSIHFEHTT